MAHLADVDQAVLVHAQVHEGAELGHVADRALQRHAFLEVLDVFHAVIEAGDDEVRARIAAGLFQLAQDVLDGDGTELLAHELLGLQALEHLGAAHELVHALARGGNDAFDHRVGFRVHARHVQRIVAAADAQKARRLLEGLGAQAGHVHQLLAALEGAVGIAPAHHRLGHAARQARDARQQRRRGRVQVHAHGVHAVLDHGVELARQLALVHVVLVLAHANALGVDLDQLGQRVLQPARNAGGAAQAHVHVGHFLRGELAGGIHGSAGLADDDLLDLAVALAGDLDQVGRQLVRLAAGRAVADGNQVDLVLFDQAGQHGQGAVPVAARLVRVDGGGVHQLARAVHHGHLDARADARVQADDGALPRRGGQQQVAQVVAKDLDGHLLGVFAQAREQVALGGQAELDAPGPGHALADQVVAGALGVAPAQVQGDLAFGQAGLAGLWLHGLDQLGLEDFQRAAAEHRQRAVRRHAANGLVVFEIVAELGDLGVVLVLGFDLLGAQQAVFPQPFAQLLHQGRVFGPALGQDVAHTIEHGQRGREIGARLAVVQGGGRLAEGLGLLVRVQRGVCKQLVGQRLDAEFLGDLSLGAALLLEGQVDVLQLLLGRRIGNGQAQRIGQLALLVDGLEHRAPAVFQLAQIAQAFVELAQLRVVQAAGHFLAVAGDERNRGSAIKQFDRSTHLLRLDIQFCGDLANDFLHSRGAPWRGIRKAAKCATRDSGRAAHGPPANASISCSPMNSRACSMKPEGPGNGR